LFIVAFHREVKSVPREYTGTVTASPTSGEKHCAAKNAMKTVPEENAIQIEIRKCSIVEEPQTCIRNVAANPTRCS